jgi:hypothetical protein
MDLAEWLLVVAIVCVFAFIVLRPDRFGRKARAGDSGSSGGDSGTYYSSDRNRSDDRTTDNDGDSGGDGGGDGGGGGD